MDAGSITTSDWGVENPAFGQDQSFEAMECLNQVAHVHIPARHVSKTT